MRAIAYVLVLLALCASGCRPRNTYVLLTIEPGNVMGDVDRIELDLMLSGHMATRQLVDPGGGAIALPTTASLQIVGLQGRLTIVGIASLNDVEVSRGTSIGEVAPGTTPLTLRFGESIVAGGDMGGSPDLAGPPHTLTVATTAVGSASGSITGSSTPAQPNLDCGATCMLSYDNGSTVTLTPKPVAGYYFGGWSGDCTGFASCSLTMDADHSVTAAFTPANRVFVTSTGFTLTQLAALGSGATMTDQVLSGADKACANAASSKTLPGHFVAWISATANSAAMRLTAANPTHQAPRGWIRLDGKPVIDALSLTGQMYYPIGLDESGASASLFTWTGTQTDGSTDTETCLNWTSTASTDSGGFGSSVVGPPEWTSGNAGQCNASQSLFCFGADYTALVPPPPPPSPAKLAFVATQFDPSTGLSGADALCNTQATAGGLGGTYHALLATSTQSAAAPSRRREWSRTYAPTASSSRSRTPTCCWRRR